MQSFVIYDHLGRPLRYPDGYRISGWIPNIRMDTGYPDGYRISGWIPNIRMDTEYPDGYRISEWIPDIKKFEYPGQP